jgi:mono/diheme cytochrome c family protein
LSLAIAFLVIRLPIASDRYTRVAVLTSLLSAAVFIPAAGWLHTSSIAASPDAVVERGRYLTHHVSMCVECHTPRDDAGRLLDSKLFEGAPIPVAGPEWSEPWAVASANIVVLAQSEPQRILSVLETGTRPDGTSPRRPMPPFRLRPADAEAIVVYLQSLGKAAHEGMTHDSPSRPKIHSITPLRRTAQYDESNAGVSRHRRQPVVDNTTPSTTTTSTTHAWPMLGHDVRHTGGWRPPLPDRPAGLVPVDDGVLTWEDRSAVENAYLIERSATGEAWTWVAVAHLPANTTAWSDPTPAGRALPRAGRTRRPEVEGDHPVPALGRRAAVIHQHGSSHSASGRTQDHTPKT